LPPPTVLIGLGEACPDDFRKYLPTIRELSLSPFDCFPDLFFHEAGRTMGLILIIVILVLLFGGGGGYWGYRSGYYGGGGHGLIWLVVLIVVLVLLFGHHGAYV
jgi:hypothetical protein